MLNKASCILYQYVIVFIQYLGDSGCDNFKKVLVQYKFISSGQWRDKLSDVTRTQMTIDNLQPGHYDVRLSVTNNKDIESECDKVTSTIGSKCEF